MTAPDIRAQAIEVLARASYAAWKGEYDRFEGEMGGGNLAPDYDDSRRWPEREMAIASATRSVAALAEAGLLATPSAGFAVLLTSGSGATSLSAAGSLVREMAEERVAYLRGGAFGARVVELREVAE